MSKQLKKWTKESLNATLSIATGFVFLKPAPDGSKQLHALDFCKVFGITDEKIKEMNKAIKKEAKKTNPANGKK